VALREIRNAGRKASRGGKRTLQRLVLCRLLGTEQTSKRLAHDGAIVAAPLGLA
jgi:hypothetical protein